MSARTRAARRDDVDLLLLLVLIADTMNPNHALDLVLFVLLIAAGVLAWLEWRRGQ